VSRVRPIGELRYRINSASLQFVNRDDMKSEHYNEYLDHIEEA
jgi:peptide methionine sulfoxide reductase MsrB